MTGRRHSASTAATWLFAAACVWPVVLGAALVDHVDGQPSLSAIVVYAGASRICHQRPERSFSSYGQQWPVCGRCSGLYLAGPVGALVAYIRPPRVRSARRARAWLLAAGLPTVATVLVEWTLPGVMTSVIRAAAAVPIGAAVAHAIVSVASEPRSAIG